jgi:quercetin dioxygenase-like cupin family protein
MLALSLATLVSGHVVAARAASSGRSARTIHGGHQHHLRQTLVALAAGHSLGDHDNPAEATLYVLYGHVRLTTTTQTWNATVGDYLVIPAQRHNLAAVEDSAVLLTVATPPAVPDAPSNTRP